MSSDEERSNAAVSDDKPVLPSPESISVDELRRILRRHEESRTVWEYLSTVDPDSGEFVPGFWDSDPPHKVRSKTYGTPLHYACHDNDGERGEEKIRIILEAARRVMVPMQMSLSLLEVHEEVYNVSERGQTEYDEKSSLGTTSLWVLIHCGCFTIESARLLCNACPGVVHMRGNAGLSLLHDLCSDLFMKGPRNEDEETYRRRQASVVQILLDAAEKTNGGAKALVQSSDEWGETYRLCTPLHILGSSCESPERIIRLFLDVWPDALKYCLDFDRNGGSVPLNDVARCYGDRQRQCGFLKVPRYESRMKSILAFLEHSSIEALAFALLHVDYFGDVGFYLVEDAIEYSESDVVSELRESVETTLRNLPRKRDENGRTLLHYIAAHSIDAKEREHRHAAWSAKSKRLRGHGHGNPEWTLDPTDEDRTDYKAQVLALEQRNMRLINELFEWLVDLCPESLHIQDIYGRKPLNFAIASGKRWGRGLKTLIDVDPDWPQVPDAATGLYPFMLASLVIADSDLTTVYELLRYAPQVVAPQAD